MKPYEEFTEDGESRKVYLSNIDEGGGLCDACDKQKDKLAGIWPLCKNVMLICQDCLQTFADEFDKE